ncbi:MAG: hypothetical protein HYY85_15295 [Deltaproteobacteria bacterium]|nr:hypothetical protein [Deltaproteobacteria bacterium]
MGRTLATFTQCLNEEIEAWQKFRRALRRADQEALDDLFAAVKQNVQAGAYLARPNPYETMLLCMLVALQRRVNELRQALVLLDQHVQALQTRLTGAGGSHPDVRGLQFPSESSADARPALPEHSSALPPPVAPGPPTGSSQPAAPPQVRPQESPDGEDPGPGLAL